MIPGHNPQLPKYEALAIYESEIAVKGAPLGAMTGTHAVIRSHYEGGRVLCISPHPEMKSGPNWMITKGVRWAADRD